MKEKKYMIRKLEVYGILKKEEYFFSVVDVISALTDSNIPRNYWSDWKRKLKSEVSELHENIVQLKMKAQDGKMRETDSLDTKGILRLIESVTISKRNSLNYKCIYEQKQIENKKESE